MIVVRESNGLLRKAINDEREKMLQVYFPRNGKVAHVPAMFTPLQLEECLKRKNYMILLKKACIQFEPNDPQYIQVTNRIYDYVNEMKDYEILYSTRFFGPMVFYLAWYKKLDNLVAFLLKNANIGDCVDVVRLHLILHGEESKRGDWANLADIDLIRVSFLIASILFICFSLIQLKFFYRNSSKMSLRMEPKPNLLSAILKANSKSPPRINRLIY